MSLGELVSCPVEPEFDPLAPEFLADPFAVMRSLPLADRPVFYAPAIDYYVVTRYRDIESIFSDHDGCSAAAAQLPLVELDARTRQILLDGGHRPQPSMVSLDEPEHARLRRPTARAFSARRTAEMEPRIRVILAKILDAIGPAGQVELAQHDRYRRYLRELVAAKAADRGDDFTSALLAIHDEQADRLTHEEIASILFSLSFAGHETTNYLIGNALRRLLRGSSPVGGDRRRSGPDPRRIEEALRYDPSVPVWRRVTKRPVTIAGFDVPEGAKLFLWLAGRGRDPTVFPDRTGTTCAATTLGTIWRAARASASIGSALGKLEARLALEALTTRFPELQLVPAQELTFHPNISFRGPQTLWATASRRLTFS